MPTSARTGDARIAPRRPDREGRKSLIDSSLALVIILTKMKILKMMMEESR